MEIKGIGNGFGAAGAGLTGAASQGGGASFMDTLKAVTDGLARTEQNATDAVGKLATGEPVDIHDVVLATEMESMAFQLALNVRNKLVEAYQELSRMQI